MYLLFTVVDRKPTCWETLREFAPHLNAPPGVRVPSALEQSATLVLSAKITCPKATIIQLTDEQTPEVAGVDLCRRFEYGGKDLQKWKCGLQAYVLSELPEDALWAILDIDTLVLRNPEPLLSSALFDCAMHPREWGAATEDVAAGMSDLMRYNGGVIFGRGSLFMQKAAIVYEGLAGIPELSSEQTANVVISEWFGDQIAITAAATEFLCYDLPREFNYTPKTPGDLPAGVVIAHYKGEKRKAWQLAKVRDMCKHT
jgi:hypothetical protein